MNTYRITCRETVYFVKEVKANSEDEANVNGYKEVKEWTEEWEIADTELKQDHEKHWVDLPPRTNIREK